MSIGTIPPKIKWGCRYKVARASQGVFVVNIACKAWHVFTQFHFMNWPSIHTHRNLHTFHIERPLDFWHSSSHYVSLRTVTFLKQIVPFYVEIGIDLAVINCTPMRYWVNIGKCICPSHISKNRQVYLHRYEIHCSHVVVIPGKHGPNDRDVTISVRLAPISCYLGSRSGCPGLCARFIAWFVTRNIIRFDIVNYVLVIFKLP